MYSQVNAESNGRWNLAAAKRCYSIDAWSAGYFDINANGGVDAFPAGSTGPGFDLQRLAQQLQADGIALPVLLRFPDVLKQRVQELRSGFAQAASRHRYEGEYNPLYPIKVNQQRSVVEALVGGAATGLEAGSKSELMAVLAVAQPEAVVVCNGYKDAEYMRLALIGQQLGMRVYIVIEKLNELELLLSIAQQMQVQPTIGVRVRLSSVGGGNWQNTGGEKSKFGLSAGQLLSFVQQLKAAGQMHCLQLLHFHLGSQISDLAELRDGMAEGVQYFRELCNLGAQLAAIDVGGGLAVDYEGSSSRSYYSMNYTIDEYADAVVGSLKQVCKTSGLFEPAIFTEAGRAMTAHHAVLITNVIDVERIDPVNKQLQLEHPNPIEAHHRMRLALEEAQSAFNAGELGLVERARWEQRYSDFCVAIQPHLNLNNTRQHELLDQLRNARADKYFCNFSVFQSLPDVWALQQVFPIVPLQRLDEAPNRRVVLQDLTCDSDGHVGQYVEAAGVESTLALHELQDGQDYLLGIFLVGAYQEILGDIHNLFGDTNAVDIRLDEQGGYQVAHAEYGDTAAQLLEYLHFSVTDLVTAYDGKLAEAELDEQRRADYRDQLLNGLHGYTYLEDDA